IGIEFGNGYIENTATVFCDQTEPDSDTEKVPIGKEQDQEEEKPDCIIEKEVLDVAGKGPIGTVTQPGDKIQYQIIVKNTGKVDLTNPIVEDTLIDITGPIETSNTDGVLEIGETWTYSGEYIVTEQDITTNGNGDGYIENTAIFDCNQLDPKSDSAQVLIKEKDQEEDEEEKPAYCISKSIIAVDETGDCIINEPGDIIKYRVIVKNEGNVDLTGVLVEDTLVDLTGPIGDEINPGILNPGETWKFFGEYIVTKQDIENNGNAKENGKGYIENTAKVSCNELPEQKCTAKQPILQKTDLCIYKSVIGTDETGDCIINNPGEIIQYQIILKNEGKVDLTGISVKDSLIELAGPSGDEINPEILNPGEIWKYTGDYAVTQQDMNTNGNGDGFIENTATLTCNELSDQKATAIQQILLTKNKNEENSQDNTNNQNNGNNQNNENGNNGSNNQNGNGNNNGGNAGGNGNSGNGHKSGGSSKGSSGAMSTSPE
ncbi:MAG: DUF7507 domain-containing protein, partial [Methanosarcina sp.]